MKLTMRSASPSRLLLWAAVPLWAGSGGAMGRAQQPSATATPTVTSTPTPKPPVQQVRVEARVLEWKLTNTKDLDFAVMFARHGTGGILNAADLTLPSSSPLGAAARLFLSDLDAGTGSIESVIEMLETAGKTQTLFNTAVIVPVDDPAKPAPTPGPPSTAPTPAPDSYGKVASNTRIPYESVKPFGGVRLASTTEYRDAGVVLECDARGIKYGEFVQLNIIVTVTDLTGFINIGLNDDRQPLRVPVFDNRRIQNEIVVKDKSVFIAGLLKSAREIERRQGIPWISELPILKWFLSNVSKDTEVSELVFLVRPEILESIAAAP